MKPYSHAPVIPAPRLLADEEDAAALALSPRDLAELATLQPMQRLEVLLSRPDAPRAVRALAPLSLYHLVREIGLEDALDLVQLASPEQLQAFVDLDAWQRDEFDANGHLEWLQVLLQLEQEEFEERIVQLDLEPLVLTLQASGLIALPYDEDGEPPPELTDIGRPWESFDDAYALVFPDHEDLSRTLRLLLRRLYTMDVAFTHRILEATRWELPTPLQETAYRLRTSRMEEIGFLPFDEAMAIYAYADPAQTRARMRAALDAQHTAARPSARAPELPWALLLPDLHRERLEGDAPSFLRQALARLRELDAQGALPHGSFDEPRFQQALLSLHHRALSADGAEPRDLDAGRRTLERVLGLLSVGLEFGAEREVEVGGRLLASATLAEVFRLGHSLTLQLAQQARRITADGRLRLSLVEGQPLSLLPPQERLLLEGLLQARPAYHPVGQEVLAPFTSYDHIEQTAQRLGLLAARITSAFGLLKLDLASIAAAAFQPHTYPPVEAITLDTLLTTAIARAALGDDPEALVPLSLDDLADLLAGPIARTRDELARAAYDPALRRLALQDSDLCRPAYNHLVAPLPTDEARRLNAALLRALCLQLLDDLAHLSPHDLRARKVHPAHLGDALLLRDQPSA
jgi:hypothetical protein